MVRRAVNDNSTNENKRKQREKEKYEKKENFGFWNQLVAISARLTIQCNNRINLHFIRAT